MSESRDLDPIDFNPSSPLLELPRLNADSPTLSLPQKAPPPPDIPLSMSSDVGERRADKWLQCTATVEHIAELVLDGRVPEDHGLRSCLGEASPAIGEGESLIILYHFYYGISFPLSSFAISVLNYFRIQLYHLSPNSISYLEIGRASCRERVSSPV